MTRRVSTLTLTLTLTLTPALSGCRLLVGAPIDKNLQPGTNRSGALYRCPVSTRLDDCEQVITDGRRSKQKHLGPTVISPFLSGL